MRLNQPSGDLEFDGEEGIRIGDDFTPDDPTRVDPVIAEIDTGSGFQRADWLGPRMVIDVPLHGIPTAQIPVRLHSGFRIDLDPTNDGGGTDTLANALPDDALVQIRTTRPSGDADLLLFRGFVQARQRSVNRNGKFVQVNLVHVVDHLHRHHDLQISGQWWATKSEVAALLADPVNARITPRRVPALPVVFNPDGQRNCLTAIARQDADEGESEYEEINMPLFTHDLDADRQAWTWARVFLWIYWRMGCTFDSADFGGLPHGIVFRRLLSTIIDNGYHETDPDSLSSLPTDTWGKLLLSKPRSHSIEGLSLWDALLWSCARAGVNLAVGDYVDFTGDDVAYKSGIYFTVPGEGRQTTLKMASRNFVTSDKPWYPDVRQASDVVNAQLSEDFSTCVNAVRSIGAPNRYEVTVELVPLWPYDAARDPQVDVDPTDSAEVETAKGNIGSAKWRNRYRRSGRLHDQHWDVLRLWGLPDYRDLQSTHARPDGPFQASSYELFDFSDLEIGETGDGQGGFDGDNLVVRPRRIWPCLTGHIADNPFPPIISLSVDSGANWSFMPAIGVQVSKRYFAVLLQSEDMDAVAVPHGDNADTFARAYISGTLRVRITCTIEGDEAAGSALVESTVSKSARQRGKLVIAPKQFEVRIRDDRSGFSGGNSQFKAGSKPATEHYDQTDLDRVTELLEREDRVRVSGPVEVPGLIVPDFNDLDATGLRPGDEVEKFEAESGQSQYDEPLSARNDGVSAAVVANIRWTYDPGSQGRSPALHTTYTLEDQSRFAAFGRS